MPVRILVLSIAVLFTFHLSGQIVDDSTKQIYGPKTTSFITLNQVLDNLGEYQTLDTSIYLFERQSLVDQSARRFQDLGVMGTALFPVFYTPAKVFGRTSGYTAYSPYSFQPSEVKFYDTKSPYIDLFILLGGGNRNIVDVGFSRNINPKWNIGFDYRRVTVDKQLASDGQGDRQIEGSSFVGYTHYKHERIPYQIMFQYSLQNHNTIELGGTRYLSSDSLRSELFQFNNALLRLDDAQTNSRERRLHIYHDYQVAKQFQLYHMLDRRTEENTYKDFSGGNTTGTYNTYTDFYPNFFVDEDSTYQQANFTSFSNEAGIKGDISSVFYRTYLRLRWVDFNYNYLNPEVATLEKYIGGYARFKWKDKFSVVGKGEYLLGGEYTLGGFLSSNLINASYQTTKNKVPFIYDRYFGNHHEWNNSFDPIFTNRLTGSLNVKFKSIEVIPKLDLTSYQGFVYFDQDRQPQQNGSTFLISSFGGDINLRFLNDKGEGWHLENELLYTNVVGAGTDAVRIPQVFYNGRLFWRGHWFSDRVPFEIGLDSHARSSYFANNYAPEIQQFYLQDEFLIDAYYKADLFVNMRLDKFFFAFKWTHIDQPTDGGYFASPYYPGQPRVIDLTVRWLFFD